MVEDEDVDDAVSPIAISAFVAFDACMATTIVDCSAHPVPFVKVFLGLGEGIAIGEDVGFAFDHRLEGVDVVVPFGRVDEEVRWELGVRLEVIDNPRESLGVDAEAGFRMFLGELNPKKEGAIRFKFARDVDAELLDFLAAGLGVLRRDGVVDLLHEALHVFAVDESVLAP